MELIVIKDVCPLCDREFKKERNKLAGISEIECDTCGNFIISDEALKELNNFINERVKISAFTRERTLSELPTIRLCEKIRETNKDEDIPKITFEDAINQFPEKISERIDKSLINISKLSGHTGYSVIINTINLEHDYPLLYADSKSIDSLNFMIKSLTDMDLIHYKRANQEGSAYELTALGWNRVYELEKSSNKDSQQGFVAMWFDDSMDSVWENGFYKGIDEAEYKPYRILEEEHNNKICDEIIKEIRRSRFVVCDVTGERCNVYFEAGFAKGFGIPVIWTCREDEVEKLHFDTRQYSHILWKDEKDLRKKLKNRILATIT